MCVIPFLSHNDDAAAFRFFVWQPPVRVFVGCEIKNSKAG